MTINAPEPIARPTWTRRTDGTLDYVSACGQYVAVYKRTIGGLACYWTFRADLPERERTMRNAKCVGGLPARIY